MNYKEIQIITEDIAFDFFEQLPTSRKIATLSPNYAVADAARDAELEPIFLNYREGNNFWQIGLHKGWVEEAGCFDLQSPYGYGGIVTNCDDGDFLLRAENSYKNWCKENNILAEFIRLHPLADSWQPFIGTKKFDRNTIVINLEEDIRSGYTPSCRRQIKKAERNMVIARTIETNGNIIEFANFYREAMQHIGAQEFYFFNDEYFMKLASMPTLKLRVCSRDEKWLSAAFFLELEKHIEYHIGATTELGRQVSSFNYLLDSTAFLAKEIGMKKFYLGGGTNSEETNSLYHFKAGFSKHTLQFCWSYYIHNAEAYYSTMERYKNAGKCVNRVLFYRQ